VEKKQKSKPLLSSELSKGLDLLFSPTKLHLKTSELSLNVFNMIKVMKDSLFTSRFSSGLILLECI